MAIRLEVTPDCRIELMRPKHAGGTYFQTYDSLEQALQIARFLLKRDLEAAKRSRFVSELEKDARAAFKELERRSPHR